MSTFNVTKTVSKVATAAIEPNRCVKADTSDTTKVKQCDTEGELVDYVSRYKVAAGDAVTCQFGGDIIVEAGAAIAAGAEVMTDNVGRVITYAAAAGKTKFGRLTNGTWAAAAGDPVSVQTYAKPQVA